MAFWFKIGLLVLSDDKTSFLVCEKDKKDITAQYIMPGGQMEEDNAVDCLKREIKEELDCDIDLPTLEFVGEYSDVAAGEPEHDVVISLYQGKLIGKPKASTEIKKLHWIGKADAHNDHVSPIVRNRIIPDLVEKGLLQ